MESLDKKNNRFLITWLIINFLFVILIIIVGGLTRLTDSGLSIKNGNCYRTYSLNQENGKFILTYNKYLNSKFNSSMI